MLDITEARSHVLSRCPALAPRAVSYRDAVGLVLAEPVVAVESVPPFVNSAVDGYAVVAASVAGAATVAPVQLPVVGEVAAGGHTDRVLQPGQAIRIMTGAPLPAGADAVVMVEDTLLLGDRSTDGSSLVAIHRAVQAGDAVRSAGDDVRAGTLLFPAGTVVRPAVLGVLASVNAREVHVVPRARVAVLSTGDELVDDGSPLQPGQIRESNRTMLHAALAEAGCEVVDLGIVRDDEAALEAVLRNAAASCDAIVTSGGVSMGDYDVVKAVLSQLADMRWMQIAIKPAKPFAFGLLPVVAAPSAAAGTVVGAGASAGIGAAGAGAAVRQVPVFGLPGNPVSSLVSFELLARPALRQMMGHTDIQRPTVAAVADDGLPRRADGKTHYVRVFAAFGADGRLHVRTVGAQGSHQLAATSLANAIAVVADGDGVAAGAPVPTMLLSVG